MRKSPVKTLPAAALFLLCGLALLYGQESPPPAQENASQNSQPPAPVIDAQSIAAREEFSWGVRAFHEGLHNKAIVNFEKALSLKPKEALYRLWLGQASYYSGLNDAAANQWDTVTDSAAGGSWLRSKLETLMFRSSPYFDNEAQDHWVTRGETAGQGERNMRFSRPSSVSADPLSGGSYVAGYGGNTVAYFDVNGSLKNRFTGGVVEFNGPFDVLPLDDGRFFVSEFNANRITLINKMGFRLNVFGDKDEEGGLKGPQYMAASDEGFLFVTDWSGKRVVKYDFNGRYIMDIGKASHDFEGLAKPTGVAVNAQELFVADREKKAVYVFDHSGNFLRSFGEGRLLAPEGLSLYRNRYLMIADSRRVMMADLQEESLSPINDLEGKAQRIMQTAVDRNGSLLVADNALNKIVYLTKLSSLYGSFFVDIKRISADRFPHVVIEAAVQDRSGTPIVGLSRQNFLLLENGMAQTPLSVASDDTEINAFLDAALLVEASPHALDAAQNVSRGITDIFQAVQDKGSLRMFWASASPSEVEARTALEAASVFNRSFAEQTSPQWRFDAAARLAASALVPKKGKQALFFLTTGEESPYGYMQYQARDLAAYMKNNGIAFYPIYLYQNTRNDTYDFIAQESGGQSVYLFRPKGLGPLAQSAANRATGVYMISYRSSSEADFGKAYIATELQTALQAQSGRTKSGYFPPLR